LPDLPAEVRDLALRLGAREERIGSVVALAQRGTMHSAPGAKPMLFRARQTIALDAIGFEWRAKYGLFGAVSVMDYLRQDSWGVQVRLVGLIPIATFIDSPAARKGETMRYLAELPLAPDAILRNPRLRWQVVDARTFIVSSLDGAGGGEVILRLSPDGLVASIEASDRPRIEGDVTVERPWQGRFSAYRCFDGRTVPTRAEVSWILPAGAFKTWEGEVTVWAMH
jgi:hypothetical protein